jgi:hypothetical protein
MNSVSAKCGHVKRRLKQGERLTGKVLEFALDIVDVEPDGSRHSDLLAGVAAKLKDGRSLDEYEYHVFVEVILLHVRLGTAR